jgi:osmotically-inducible protein OsmY
MIPRWLSSTALIVLMAPALSGCVAAAAVGTFAGVQTLRQERTVGDALDDRAIKTTIDSKLRQTDGLRFGIATSVVEGRVVLAGRVSTPEQRLDATRIAWSIDGVVKVDNDLEVTDSSGWLDRPQDFIMRQALVAKLLTDSSIKEVNYSTDVVHGVVYLMGVGQDQAEVDRVVAHAMSLNNVKRVENYVVLKDDPIRQDGSVTSQNENE